MVDVAWPETLQELTILTYERDVEEWGTTHDELFLVSDLSDLSDFNQAINEATWPASLRRGSLGGRCRQSLRGLGTWMPSLQGLTLFVDDYSGRRSSSI